jgi:carbamoyl-phosphate synthase large subunit
MDAPELDRAVARLPPRGSERTSSPRARDAGRGAELADRLFYVADAMRLGITDEELPLTAIDPWFLAQIRRIVVAEKTLAAGKIPGRPPRVQALGFSDRQIAEARRRRRGRRARRAAACGIRPVYARVDTCAAEFVAHTPYLYSTYETDRARRAVTATKPQGRHPRRRAEPHRAGDRVRLLLRARAQALRGLGFETVMVNCNPETVSTDYDTADRLYFEPLTLEDVLSICDDEKPSGVIVQFGGQTPLKLALPLAQHGVRLLGTERRRHRSRRGPRALRRAALQAGLRSGRAAASRQGRRRPSRSPRRIGYPVLVRPSYVLGGRAMMIAYDRDELASYVHLAVEAASDAGNADHPRRRVLEGRHRGRRRLRGRRHARGDRRRDAAHRGGGASTRATRRASCLPHSLGPRSCSRSRSRPRCSAPSSASWG